MTSRSKQHGLKVAVISAGDSYHNEGIFATSAPFFVLTVTRFEEKKKIVKRYRDLCMFRAATGELADRMTHDWPEPEDVAETRNEELASQIELWFGEFLIEGPPLSNAMIDQLETFLELHPQVDGEFFTSFSDRTAILDRKSLFTRHKQTVSTGFIKMGKLNVANLIMNNEFNTFYCGLSDNIYLFEDEEAMCTGTTPVHIVTLALFWVSMEDASMTSVQGVVEEKLACFNVRTPGRIVNFSSPNPREVVSWVECLRSLQKL